MYLASCNWNVDDNLNDLQDKIIANMYIANL